MQAERAVATLAGYLDDWGKCVRVWCEACDTWHQHGWPDGPTFRGPSNKGEHCWTDWSPHRWRGYNIVLVGRLMESQRNALTREIRSQRRCIECDEQRVRGRCKKCGAFRHGGVCRQRHVCRPLAA